MSVMGKRTTGGASPFRLAGIQVTDHRPGRRFCGSQIQGRCKMNNAPIKLKDVVVLAIEDDTSNLAMLGTMLRRMEMHAFIDPTGDNARVMAHALKPHIILTDLNLPRRTGFDLLADLRSDPRLRHIPVVALSAMETGHAIPRCQQAGFDGFIAKPFRSRHLARQMKRVLAGERVWDLEDVASSGI